MHRCGAIMLCYSVPNLYCVCNILILNYYRIITLLRDTFLFESNGLVTKMDNFRIWPLHMVSHVYLQRRSSASVDRLKIEAILSRCPPLNLIINSY
jgi:hypothetical protein